MSPLPLLMLNAESLSLLVDVSPYVAPVLLMAAWAFRAAMRLR